MSRQYFKVFYLLLFIAVIGPARSYAGEQGHYLSFANVRDVAQPPTGFYATWYDLYYHADEYKDGNGNSIEHISRSGEVTTDKTLNLGGGRNIPITLTGTVEADIDVDIDMVIHAAYFAWVSDLEKWGWHYGVIVSPSFGYSRIDVEGTATANGTLSIGDLINTPVSGSKDFRVKDSKYGFGDTFVAPVWLGKHGKRYDAQALYGFYAPTGSYSEADIANIGMGFWTHAWGVNGLYYLNDIKATALMGAFTYELHSSKYAKDVKPGQDVWVEYGISQYLHERFEVSAIGASQWQISQDTGSAAINEGVKDRIHSVGGQFTLWIMKFKMFLSGRCSWEYGARDRFEGLVSTINLTYIFGEPIDVKLEKAGY